MHSYQVGPALRMLSPVTTSTAYTPAGAVTALTTVVMVQMKQTVPLVSRPPVQLPTSPVIMTSAFLKTGCVMVTMTAAMAQTSKTAVCFYLRLVL